MSMSPTAARRAAAPVMPKEGMSINQASAISGMALRLRQSAIVRPPLTLSTCPVR